MGSLPSLQASQLRKASSLWESAANQASQIPSQPMTKKASSGLIALFITSGIGEINCSAGFRAGFFLYSRSPRALLKFRFPLTLPSIMKPPAFEILVFSISLSGLWSSDKAKTFLLLHKMHLESPALAQ